MNNRSVLEIPNIYIRFEPNINNGTVFLFNRYNGEMYEGDSQMYEIIQQINGENTIEEICIALAIRYDMPKEEMSDIIFKVLINLEQRGLVICKTK